MQSDEGSTVKEIVDRLTATAGAIVIAYCWFSYDVIKSMTMQIMINFFQILGWPLRPYNLSVSNLKSLGQMKRELWAKEVSDFSIILYGEMGWGHLHHVKIL